MILLLMLEVVSRDGLKFVFIISRWFFGDVNLLGIFFRLWIVRKFLLNYLELWCFVGGGGVVVVSVVFVVFVVVEVFKEEEKKVSFNYEL